MSFSQFWFWYFICEQY